MYSLLKGVYKYLVQKDEYFLLILGLDNAGKSTYLEAVRAHFESQQRRRLPPHKITTTVGLNIGHALVDDVRVHFWDLGGQQQLQSLWNKYFDECHGVVYVVDSADRSRMDESKLVFDATLSDTRLSGVPLLVLANKQDLSECMGVRELRPMFTNAHQLIGLRECMVMPVSALTGEGIGEGIVWMVECLKRNACVRPPRDHE